VDGPVRLLAASAKAERSRSSPVRSISRSNLPAQRGWPGRG